MSRVRFTDASFGRQQNGKGVAGRYQYVQPGVGLPRYRGPVYRDHGSDFRFQLDRVLLRVLEIQQLREKADGWSQDDRGRLLQSDAVLR